MVIPPSLPSIIRKTDWNILQNKNDWIPHNFKRHFSNITNRHSFGSVRKLGCKQQAYAHSFVNLKRKKGISATPLNWLLNASTLALNDSAPALVCLFTK